jgi:alpha-ketoglutarate-dependent 2,4-dichlorophenoxyacetate dioxygenase
MELTLKPLHPLFVAEAGGVSLAEPLAPEAVRAIDAAMDQYAVLVWRKQPMTPEAQMRCAASFGRLDSGLKKVFKRKERLPYEELIDISNVGADGQVVARDAPKNLSNFANMLWHSDSSFQDPRAAYSMLSAVVLPSWGGDTQFTDLRAAYDALPDRTKEEIAGLDAEHYALHTRIMLGDDAYTDEQKKALPPVAWPLAQTHRSSGRRVLFVGVHATRILGWPVAEGRMYLHDLLEHATQREFVYTHKWQVGDLVMWDNRATLHRGRRYDIAERRELRRTTIDDIPAQALAA